METINDIVREMRCGMIPKHRHDRELLLNFSDRIEAAVKALEADRDNWRRQALDEDARANVAQLVTDCNQQKDWRKICAACQEGEPPEDCEYFGEPGGCNAPTLGKHPTCSKSSQVGSAAKMREVVAETEKSIDKCISILTEIPDSCGYGGLLEDAADELCELKEQFIKPALAAPARNCDVGTAEEQSKRFKKYCALNKDFEWGCEKCPIFPYKIIKCEFIWSQLPYESEVKK